MLKFAVILLVITLLFRWALGKWPWDFLAGPPTHKQKIAEARKTLGVKRFSTRDDILSAHKRILAEVHPDRGGSSEKVHEANDARDLLLADLPPAERESNGAENEDSEPPA